MSENTIAVQACLDRLNAGDLEVRGELMEFAFERLGRMTKKMKNDFDRIGRWEQTEDICQNASLRLFEALKSVQIADVRHFYRLAALQIRRELIDMCRHYNGPQGAGANHQTQMRSPADQSAALPAYELAEVSEDPRKMQQWGEFHEAVGKLPETEREVFEMLWYHELPQNEVAEIIGISTRQVKRIWRNAKLKLHDALGGSVPD